MILKIGRFFMRMVWHTFLSDENYDQTVNDTKLNNWILQLRQGRAKNLTE